MNILPEASKIYHLLILPILYKDGVNLEGARLSIPVQWNMALIELRSRHAGILDVLFLYLKWPGTA